MGPGGLTVHCTCRSFFGQNREGRHMDAALSRQLPGGGGRCVRGAPVLVAPLSSQPRRQEEHGEAVRGHQILNADHVSVEGVSGTSSG